MGSLFSKKSKVKPRAGETQSESEQDNKEEKMKGVVTADDDNGTCEEQKSSTDSGNNNLDKADYTEEESHAAYEDGTDSTMSHTTGAARRDATNGGARGTRATSLSSVRGSIKSANASVSGVDILEYTVDNTFLSSERLQTVFDVYTKPPALMPILENHPHAVHGRQRSYYSASVLSNKGCESFPSGSDPFETDLTPTSPRKHRPRTSRGMVRHRERNKLSKLFMIYASPRSRKNLLTKESDSYSQSPRPQTAPH